MKAGDRIVVTGGPWPERIGCAGRVVTDDLDPTVYPRRGLGNNEEIILLDDDPVVPAENRPEGWTCVIYRTSLTRVTSG